jgi:heptosyltransferase-2
VLVPAGARNTLRDDALRRWPVESYVELAEALLQRGLEVVLAGGPDDLWASQHFAHLAVTDLTGRLSLLETLALLDSAAMVITHDTGPLHLAGLTSTAIISIFGPTDPHGRLPQRANCVALWGGEGFACRPCYDGRDYAPCAYNGCMHQVTAAMVLAEVDTLFSAQQADQPQLPRIVTPPHSPLVSLSAELPR